MIYCLTIVLLLVMILELLGGGLLIAEPILLQMVEGLAVIGAEKIVSVAVKRNIIDTQIEKWKS